MTSPTQRTLQYLRKSGYVVQVTEHWVPMARVRRDLFGFVDVLALLDGQVLAVQTTSKDHVSNRVRKIVGTLPLPADEKLRQKAEAEAAAIRRALTECLRAGWTIAVHGWAKGARQPVIRYVTEADIPQ